MPPISQETRDRIAAEERVKLEAEIRAQVRAEVRAELTEMAVVAPQTTYSGPRPGTYEFWSMSPDHSPSVRTSGGEGFLRFHQGHLIVDNEADANLIRTQLRGMVWESNLPPGYEAPKCRITKFSPRNFEAWQAYQDWITPRIPVGYDGFSG